MASCAAHVKMQVSITLCILLLDLPTTSSRAAPDWHPAGRTRFSLHDVDVPILSTESTSQTTIIPPLVWGTPPVRPSAGRFESHQIAPSAGRFEWERAIPPVRWSSGRMPTRDTEYVCDAMRRTCRVGTAQFIQLEARLFGKIFM